MGDYLTKDFYIRLSNKSLRIKIIFYNVTI